jgi:RHS repeat-associated protein
MQKNINLSRSLGRIGLLTMATFALALSTTPVEATVGRTPGTFAVSSDGATTYTIPLSAPPGPDGLQPKIALTYNSRQGNGSLGVGWNLAGLSSIYRCNLTYAQDGTAAPVSLSTSDGYCLNGQRLRLKSGTYGVAGSTYQTEITHFELVTAYGSAGNGPAYFIVQTPDGRTLQYGNGGGSQIVAAGTAWEWFLNEVSDPASNTMTVSYSTATGTAVPSKISWTPISLGASTYSYTMEFNYGTNVLPVTGYVAGTLVQNPNLLGSITIKYNSSQVKQYVLTYQQSGTTGRDRLTQVKECAASGSNCLYPTNITYQDGSPGVSSSPTNAVGGPIQSCNGKNGSIAHYDFNGDGYIDLLYQSGGACYVAFGSASGYGPPKPTGLTSATLIGDLLGTGSAGLLANNGGTWYYYTWNGSSFTNSPTGLAYDSSAAQFALADINGDGLPDLVAMYGAQSSSYSFTTRLNTSSGSVPSFSSAATAAFTDGGVTSVDMITPDDQYGRVPFFDFNGDGRQDLVIHENSCLAPNGFGGCQVAADTFKELLSQTSGTFTATQIAQIPNQGGSIVGTAFFAKLNDDTCTDTVLVARYVEISTCNGNSAAQITATYPIVAVMDWNGDGLADLIENNGGTLYVQLSDGTGFGTVTATSLAYNSNCSYLSFDADGDGLDDLGCASSASGTTGFAYYSHNGVGTLPDLLATVTDGYGNSVSTSFASLTRAVNSVYFEWNDAQFPYQNYNGPVYLTSQAVFSDPSSATGGTFYQNYFYSGLWLNLQGRGLSALGDVQTYDSRNGVWHTVGYQRAFPYNGMFGGEVQSSNNSPSGYLLYHPATVDKLIFGSGYQQFDFPFISTDTVQSYELGSPSTRLVKTTATTYIYDNYGNAKNITTTVTDNDSGSQYYGQYWTTAVTNTTDPSTSPWCLTLLTQTQVAYTDSLNSTPVTRTRQYTPDLVNCRYSEIVTEPSSNFYKVTEDLGYTNGKLTSDTVTGVGMAARTTSLTWDTTGQFPLTITDASDATTTFVYDYTLGLLSGVTDPNGQPTNWQYGDGFGRKTQETRPDGTYTQWVYNDCATSGGCLLGAHGLATQHYVNAYGGAPISNGTDYSDPADRPLLSDQMMLGASSWNRNEVRYDNLGRKVQEAMPCIWTTVSTPCAYWATTSYDVLNRATQVQRPINATNNTLQTTGYQYAGDTTTVTDPQGHAKVFLTDPNGWLRRSADAYSYAIVLGYDAAGSRTSVTDSLGNALWSASPYAYGIQPFLLGFTDMDRGSWGFTVDPLGEPTAWTDAKGQQFSQSYDSLSRPITRKEQDLFTQWNWGSTPSLHNVGMLQSVCTGQGANPTNCTTSPGLSESRTYDSNARPYQRTINLPGGVSYTYTWTYSATTGLLDTLTYPVSTCGVAFKVQYGYSAGILASISDALHSPNVTLWQANAQNPAGQLTQETINNGGIVVNRAFDAVTHWLASVQAGVGGGTGLLNQSFLYDQMGNVTERQDNSSLALTEDAYYDNDYRLLTTKLNGTQNLSITYDNTMGNIVSRSDVAGGATWTYSPTQKHAVTQAGSSSFVYTYDANGNMSSRQGQTIQWSSYNYPIAISAGSGSTTESISFSYGPDRNRWQQIYTGNGTTETTDYIGGLMDVVISGSSVDYRHYIYAGTEPVAVYSRKSSGVNAFSYFLADHQSSVAKIVNASTNAVAVSESFTPFGTRRNPSTWSGAASTPDLTASAGISRQGYTFQTQLGLWAGLNHMNGRVQDAITGRFLSADPSVPDEGNPQEYNRYTYAGNNPLTRVDPTGFDDCDETDPCPPLTEPAGGLGDVSSTITIAASDYDTPGQVPPSQCDGFGCLTFTQVCSGGGCTLGAFYYANDASSIAAPGYSSGTSGPPGGGSTGDPALGGSGNGGGGGGGNTSSTGNHTPQEKCWNGQPGGALDFVGGLARQVGNDLVNLAQWLASFGGLNQEVIQGFDAFGGPSPIPSNNTNAGIFGADLAPAFEIAVPTARLGYVAEAGAIPNIPGITAPVAVAARNYLKGTYRFGLFPNAGMGNYEAFVAAGKSDAQIIASAGRTNGGVNTAAATSAAAGVAHTGCP